MGNIFDVSFDSICFSSYIKSNNFPVFNYGYSNVYDTNKINSVSHYFISVAEWSGKLYRVSAAGLEITSSKEWVVY